MVMFNRKGPMNNQGISDMSIEDFTTALGDNLFTLPGLDFGGGTGTGTTTKASDILNKLKFQYQIQKDASAAQEAANAKQKAEANLLAQNTALSNLYSSGAYGDSSRNYVSALDKMQGTSEQGINDQLARSLASLNEGYGQAQNLTNTGYESLVKALSGYTNPYGGMQAQQPVPVTNALEGILNANNANVGDYQNILNSEMAMNQANQQNLLSALAQISQSGSQSRSAEAELANQFAQANLGANKANYQGQLQTNASQALTDLANQIAQRKAEAEAQAEQQKFALAQLLAQAGIDVTKLKPPAAPVPPVPPVEDFSNLPLDLSQIDFSGLNNMFNPGTSPVAQVQPPSGPNMRVQPPSGPNMSLSQDVLDQLAARRRGF
jgi:hypothetical protein